MKQHQNISILIVLFNKELNESKTLISLLQCESLAKVFLKILNNGPKEILVEGEFFEDLLTRFDNVIFETRLENAPLSKLYNEFIDGNVDSDYFVILDDDSKLDGDFISNITEQDADILVPRILSIDDGRFYYPTQHGVVVENEGMMEPAELMSISSGLTISKRLVSLMLSHYPDVFDESFALYGIDTSFFLRIRRMTRNNPSLLSVKCISLIRHSLSRAQEKNSSEFRTVERLYDFAITAKHYPEYVSYLCLFKRIVKYLVKVKIKYVWILSRYYIYGKHPKC